MLPQYKSGDEFLFGLGMSFTHRYRDIGFMCAYMCVFPPCSLRLRCA